MFVILLKLRKRIKRRNIFKIKRRIVRFIFLNKNEEEKKEKEKNKEKKEGKREKQREERRKKRKTKRRKGRIYFSIGKEGVR